MTLDKARELLNVQISFGGGYNRNGAHLIMAEVVRKHGQSAADQLITELNLEQIFGFAPGPAISEK